MRAAEGGKKIVQRILVRQINDGKLCGDFIAIAMV
jgi:hypothetical protein